MRGKEECPVQEEFVFPLGTKSVYLRLNIVFIRPRRFRNELIQHPGTFFVKHFWIDEGRNQKCLQRKDTESSSGGHISAFSEKSIS